MKQMVIAGGAVAAILLALAAAKNFWPEKDRFYLTLHNDYLTLTADKNNQTTINLSRARLRFSSGQIINLPQAAAAYSFAKINRVADVQFRPGERTIIKADQSPLGVSFRLNRCIGYLEQFQKFTPPLPQECPLTKELISLDLTNPLNQICQNYINDLPACLAPLTYPNHLSPNCQTLIAQEINYPNCVARLEQTENFYRPEWRLYLNQMRRPWQDKDELIELIDGAGQVLARLIY